MEVQLRRVMKTVVLQHTVRPFQTSHRLKNLHRLQMKLQRKQQRMRRSRLTLLNLQRHPLSSLKKHRPTLPPQLKAMKNRHKVKTQLRSRKIPLLQRTQLKTQLNLRQRKLLHLLRKVKCEWIATALVECRLGTQIKPGLSCC